MHPFILKPFLLNESQVDGWIGGYFTVYPSHAREILLGPTSDPILIEFTYGSGYITAYGSGSFVQGMASVVQNGDGSAFAQLTASNVARGAWVGGYARSTGTSASISASANGALAFGNAVDTSILASAAGAIQFGPGTNNRANSLRVGVGLWFMGATGTPSTPSNGMMWVANGNIYGRTGGVTKNLSNI